MLRMHSVQIRMRADHTSKEIMKQEIKAILNLCA